MMLASPLKSFPINTVQFKLGYFQNASYACKLQCGRNFVRWTIGFPMWAPIRMKYENIQNIEFMM